MPTIAETLQSAVQLHRSGDLPRAEQIYRQVLQADPRNADAWHLLGMVALQVGNFPAAADCIRRAIHFDASQAAFHANLAEAHRGQGQTEEAIAAYRKALAIEPRLPEAHNNLGTVYQDLGRVEEARAEFQEAIRLQPGYAQAHVNLGSLWHDQGKLDEAAACYRRAVRAEPNYAPAYNSLGSVLYDQRRYAEATQQFSEALRRDPRLAEAHNNLGNVLKTRGQLDEARQCYERAVQARPDFAAAHYNLGAILQLLADPYQAMLSYQRALALRPNFPQAHLNLSMTLQGMGKLAEAAAACREAIRLQPGLFEAHVQLGAVLHADGRLEEALEAWERAMQIKADDGLKLRAALALPAVAASREDVQLQRRRIEENVARLMRESLSIDDPIEKVNSTTFFLAYQGYNDRELAEKIAGIHARATRSLSFTAPHCLRQRDPAARPIKVGFLSRFFFDHTIGKLNGGLMRRLNRDEFHVTMLRVPGPHDEAAAQLQHGADQTIVLSPLFEPARQQVAALELDVLIYTDIGMDILTHYLAFSRLARVQCTSWGHPVTSGIPTIDYFISSRLIEPPEAEDHYSERLALLEHLPTCYALPDVSAPAKERADFGLSPDDHLYVCPHSLFKLHPEFDAVLEAILNADFRGRVVLVDPRIHWTELLRRRLRQALGATAERVVFVPRMPAQDFTHLLRVADVLLDPIHFGGGNTTFEALALGTPIVTWPGRFMRGRVTEGCYRQMDLCDCVAEDLDHYVQIAVRLGTDPQWRGEVSRRILERRERLFDHPAAVRELEDFLRRAVQETAL